MFEHCVLRGLRYGLTTDSRNVSTQYFYRRTYMNNVREPVELSVKDTQHAVFKLYVHLSFQWREVKLQ